MSRLASFQRNHRNFHFPKPFRNEEIPYLISLSRSYKLCLPINPPHFPNSERQNTELILSPHSPPPGMTDGMNEYSNPLHPPPLHPTLVDDLSEIRQNYRQENMFYTGK